MQLQLRVKQILLFGFVALILTQLIAQYFFTSSTEDKFSALSNQSHHQSLLARYQKHIDLLLRGHENAVSMTHALVTRHSVKGSIISEEVKQLMRDFFSVQQQLEALYIGTEQGQFWGLVRLDNDIMTMEVKQGDKSSTLYFFNEQQADNEPFKFRAAGFDVTARSWYQEAASHTEQIWSTPFTYHAFDEKALPLSKGVYDDNDQLLGVVGANLFFRNFSKVFDSSFSGRADSAVLLVDNEEPVSIILENELTNKEHPSWNEHRTFVTSSQFRPDFSSTLDMRDGLSFTLHTQYLSDDYESAYSGIAREVFWSVGFLSIVLSGGFYLLLTIVTSPFRDVISLVSNDEFDVTKPYKPKKSKWIRLTELEAFEHTFTQLSEKFNRIMVDYEVAHQREIQYKHDLERLAKLPMIMEDGVVMLDEKGAVTWCNDSFVKLTGFQNLETVKVMFFDWLAFKVPNFNESELSQAVSDNQYCKIQLQITIISGAKIWFDISFQPYDSESGENLYFFVFRSIDSQKQYEEQLSLWKTVFTAAKWGIGISKTDNLNLIAANPYFCQLLGYTLDEMINLSVNDFTDESTKLLLPQIVKDVEKHGFTTYEGNLITKDGCKVPVFVSVSAVVDDKGEVIYRVANIQDLSEKLNLQSQAQQTNKMEALGSLTSAIVHDFNNILSSVLFNAELATLQLSKIKDASEQSALDNASVHLTNIKASTETASNLIKEILIFSKRNLDKIELVDLNEIIEEVVRIMEFKFSKNTSISIDRMRSTPIVKGSNAQMMQLILNLVSNANNAIIRDKVEYGKIEIRLSKVEGVDSDKPNLLLEVQDNALGIDDRIAKKVFEPFVSFDNRKNSAGIGLALAKKIVELHGGWITFESRKGSGSNFKVYLPAIFDFVNDSAKSQPNNEELIPNKPFHVLIVDDDPQVLSGISEMLKHYGFEVTEFDEAYSAYGYIADKEKPVDIVITDLIMPGMDGRDFIRSVRCVDKHVPIIVATGFAEPEEMDNLKNIGCNHVLLKPLAISNLLQAIRSLLPGGGIWKGRKERV